MKSLFLILLTGILFTTSKGSEVPFYVSTHTGPSTGKGIYLGVLNTETGQLGPINVEVETKEPTFMVLSPDHKFLYASQESNPSAVSAFKRDSANHLTLINTKTLPGNYACHVSIDSTGRNVLVANYGSGDILCLQTNSDGSLGDQTAHIPFSGSGPYISRQKSPHAHGVYVDHDNQFVYACDLGTDSIWTFKFDASKGNLIAADPPAAKVPPGSGCRHLAEHPNARFVYVNNEMGMSVSTFARDLVTGALVLRQTISMLPVGVPPEPNTSAEIFCHPNGHFLYISNRTCDTISTFRITSDGTLDSLSNFPALVISPRSFAIDSTGNWLLVAGEKSHSIALFKINQLTGALTPTGQSVEVPSPECVLFAD